MLLYFYIAANMDGRIGAVGFLPVIVPKSLVPLAVIRVNQETYEPIRGANGLCIRAEISKNLILLYCNET